MRKREDGLVRPERADEKIECRWCCLPVFVFFFVEGPTDRDRNSFSEPRQKSKSKGDRVLPSDDDKPLSARMGRSVRSVT